LKKPPSFLAGPKELLDTLPQCRVAGTSLVQVRSTLLGSQTPSGAKNSKLAFNGITHEKAILYPAMRKTRPKGASIPSVGYEIAANRGNRNLASGYLSVLSVNSCSMLLRPQLVEEPGSSMGPTHSLRIFAAKD
jgi:hypothetical protein